MGGKTPMTLAGSIYQEGVSRRVGYRKTPDLSLGFSFARMRVTGVFVQSRSGGRRETLGTRLNFV